MNAIIRNASDLFSVEPSSDEIYCETLTSVALSGSKKHMIEASSNTRFEEDVMELRAMSSQELVNHAKGLVSEERRIVVELIRALRWIERRKVHFAMGYRSLTDFCMKELGLTEDQTWKRLQVSRASEFHPQALEKLEKGEIHLSHMAMASTRITQANAQVVYEAMVGRSKRQFEKMLRRIMPDGTVMPERKDETTKLVIELSETELADLERVKALLAAKGKLRRCTNENLLSALVEFALVKLDPLLQAERVTRKKASAKAASGQAEASAAGVPSPEREPSLEQKPELKPEPKAELKPEQVPVPNTALAPAPGQATPVKWSRYIPAAVRHAVMLRDGCRCTFVGDDERRCEVRVGLEFDHIVMVSEGGAHTVKNLRLMCRAHNTLLAERRLGVRFVREKIEAKKKMMIKSDDVVASQGARRDAGELGDEGSRSRCGARELDGAG